ncbi:phosphatidylinositol mannoside acyltransferase [Carbonactinospora thermoautotrophica]|uniref:phosphatidylinositol mannoside acyltransferase n=1 Tax=Carbonactinospora thermoautotrophica TaxID=1469144 RepID=UPI00226D82DF|nr:phosphatidylinositol mannoside acyltransferase [Carbonactinospora thermoautotrophica]MCX9193064.1 phosphatidylinositol mannoside acyltransferase [Carbonactinospora thermoautotrophica]
MKDRLIVWTYFLGWAVVKRLPEPLAAALFRAIADYAWWRRGRGVRQLEANLRRVVPDAGEAELRALSRAGMRSYLRYWLEVFRLPTWSPDRIVGTFHIEGEHHLRNALAEGRGVVVVLPHMANWDHAGAWAVLSGMPLTTVAERLRPQELFDRFVAYRRGLGLEVLPLDGGPATLGLLARRLRSGQLICLVADRDLTGSGLEVTLCGEAVRMPGGPAVLALRTGAALIPAVLWYGPDGTHARLYPPVPVPRDGDREAKATAMTQAVADVFTAGLREHPEDWHMLQPLWLADVGGDRAR